MLDHGEHGGSALATLRCRSRCSICVRKSVATINTRAGARIFKHAKFLAAVFFLYRPRALASSEPIPIDTQRNNPTEAFVLEASPAWVGINSQVKLEIG